MYSRKIALSLARQTRGCPPFFIRKDPLQAAQVKQHLSICPHCLEESMEQLDASERLAEKIVETRGRPRVGSGKPANRGQIRYLSSHSGCWREGFYYNPPMVLVLRVIRSIADEIKVAQLYDDLVLAAPGDLILDENRTGGAGKLFVECWNTYTSRAEHLGSLVGEVPEETVGAVESMGEGPDRMPEWAALPIPMKDEDPRKYFRRLEVDVAYTFASRAAGELMDELQKPVIRTVYPSSNAIRAAIEEKIPGISFPANSQSMEDLLATAQFPPEMLRWAAADSESKTIIGGVVVFREGELDSIGYVEVNLFGVHESGEGLVEFGGRFPIDRKNGPPVEALFRFIDSDDSVLEPVASSWDREKGEFIVKFSASSRDWKRLRMAVVYEAGQQG